MRGPRSYLKLGDWNAVCYFCGFKYKASELVRYWEGFYVCKECWEPRHPQDFVRGTMDEQTPPWTQPLPLPSFTYNNVFLGMTDGVTRSYQLGDGLYPTTVTAVTVNNFSFTAVNLVFGTWNGSNTSAPLLDPSGHVLTSATVSSIYRNDWQGNQLLYPTARTNIVLNSAASTTDWYATGAATWGAAAPSTPSGSGVAYTLVAGTANNVQATKPHAQGIVANSSLSGFVDAAPDTYNYASIQFLLSIGGVVSGTFDFTTGLFVGAPYTYGGAPVSSMTQTAIPLPNGYYRLIFNFTLTSTQSLNNPLIYNIYSTSAGGPFAGDGVHGAYLANAQIVADVPIGSLIPTTGSPVTLTDYTLTGTTVNLAQAPAATAVTTWNGTGVSFGSTPAYTVNSTGLITFSLTPAAGGMVYASGSEEMT